MQSGVDLEIITYEYPFYITECQYTAGNALRCVTHKKTKEPWHSNTSVFAGIVSLVL